MGSPFISLLVLAGIAIFLILRLRAVLGTRDGFERPVSQNPQDDRPQRNSNDFGTSDDGSDRDITDHVPENSASAQALTRMKAIDPEFNLSEFLHGAKGAYEMILMAFERGDLESVKPFVSEDIFDTFNEVVKERERQGLRIDANFVGVREIALSEAEYDEFTREGEITIKFVGEMTSAVLNSDEQIIEGSKTEIRRQKDIWTFARTMGSGDPNWQLVATDA